MADYDQKYQLGDSIFAYIYIRDWTYCTMKIDGSGYMWDSADNFVQLENYRSDFTAYDTWRGVAGRLHGDIIINDSIKSISKKFINTTDLYQEIDNLIIGFNVEFIDDYAFEALSSVGVKNIKSYSRKLTTLGRNVFNRGPYGEGGMITADFGGTVKYVGVNCFQYCRNVKYLNLGPYIVLGNSAFNSCNSLIEFNEYNTIGDMLPDGGSAGYFYYCNYIDHFTFAKDAMIPDGSSSFRNDGFKVNLNAGSNLNEDGLQITTIYGDNAAAKTFPWIRRNNRYVIFEDLPLSGFLACAHKGKWVLIDGYDKNTGKIPIAHEGDYKYIKASDVHSSTETPLFVKHDNQWYQIKY